MPNCIDCTEIEIRIVRMEPYFSYLSIKRRVSLIKRLGRSIGIR